MHGTRHQLSACQPEKTSNSLGFAERDFELTADS
jgi:hypothetical protein